VGVSGPLLLLLLVGWAHLAVQFSLAGSKKGRNFCRTLYAC